MLTTLTQREETDRALRTLVRAREANRDRTVGIVINARTTVYVKPAQAADETFMRKLRNRWNGRL